MRLRVEDSFDAATSLPGHDRCAALHGHTYRVEMQALGEEKDGVLTDFRDLKHALRAELDRFDHKDLSRIFPYPSCEALCLELCRSLSRRLPEFEMVRVWEGEGKWVELEKRDLASTPLG